MQTLKHGKGTASQKKEAQSNFGNRVLFFWSDNLAATLHPHPHRERLLSLSIQMSTVVPVSSIESRDLRMARQFIDRYPLHSFHRLGTDLLHDLRAVKNCC